MDAQYAREVWDDQSWRPEEEVAEAERVLESWGWE